MAFWNDDSSQSGAAAQVFENPSLLLAILSHTEPRTVVRSQRVCKGFHELISGTTTLRTLLGCLPQAVTRYQSPDLSKAYFGSSLGSSYPHVDLAQWSLEWSLNFDHSRRAPGQSYMHGWLLRVVAKWNPHSKPILSNRQRKEVLRQSFIDMTFAQPTVLVELTVMLEGTRECTKYGPMEARTFGDVYHILLSWETTNAALLWRISQGIYQTHSGAMRWLKSRDFDLSKREDRRIRKLIAKGRIVSASQQWTRSW